MKRIIYYIIIAGFGAYIFILGLNNQLAFYIHPRYISASLVAGGVSLFIGVFGILWTLAHIKSVRKFLLEITQVQWPEVLIISMLIIGIFLPAKTLSSATANQRSLDLNSVNLSGTKSASIVSQFNSSTENYSIGEWVAALSNNLDINKYVGKKVKVSGFIYHPDFLPNDEFLVARFVITCCAVDARPVGLYAKFDWQKNFVHDDWVEVTGKFTSADINGHQELLIEVDNMNLSEVPANPYIY